MAFGPQLAAPTCATKCRTTAPPLPRPHRPTTSPHRPRQSFPVARTKPSPNSSILDFWATTRLSRLRDQTRDYRTTTTSPPPPYHIASLPSTIFSSSTHKTAPQQLAACTKPSPGGLVSDFWPLPPASCCLHTPQPTTSLHHPPLPFTMARTKPSPRGLVSDFWPSGLVVLLIIPFKPF